MSEKKVVQFGIDPLQKLLLPICVGWGSGGGWEFRGAPALHKTSMPQALS